jgi:uncharacterized membrane protein
MILYNTLMGICAGLSLILVPVLGRALYRRQTISVTGWSLTFGVLGTVLAILGGLMATTWPLTANPPINIAFGEPNFLLGLLMLAGAVLLWRNKESLNTLSDGKGAAAELAQVRLTRALVPLSYIVGALGLVLLAITLAMLRFNLVGAAPEAEPITGLLHNHPVVENTFFVILYGLSALGALLAPFALRKHRPYFKIMCIAWLIAGILFLLFSAMNYYTHIGLLVNLGQGTNYRY